MTIPEAQKRRGELCNEINELSSDPLVDQDLLIAKQKEAQELWEFINKSEKIDNEPQMP